ncbi:MAG TPA: aminopeptidase P N-terminal domain-containing protein [Burkholderiales bacterium]|nr:aminopeptidase P N-terminal domain-containing protein [Burkholderiales bacterium]
MNGNEIFARRRAELARRMGAGVAVVRTALERVRNRDAHYPFRFDSYFYYLTGFPEPGAALVLVAGAPHRAILFCRDKDPEREVWDGYRVGPEQAREAFGVDEARPIGELDQFMPQVLANQPAVFCDVGGDPEWDTRVIGWINKVKEQVRSGVCAPGEIRDLRAHLDDMRLIKDSAELATMRRAAEISVQAHRRAMRAARPGRREYEIEAELLHEFRRHGSQAPAYTPIVAGGANACILHYVRNDATLNDGDLLLIDAGCELDGYAADITRTFPVNGRFAGPQREVYELVLAAQAAAIEQVKPGNEWEDPHRAAVKILAQGMIDLGLCKGTVDGVIESGDYRRFYMHRTGHWLGMDVHDAGDYKHAGAWRKLAPGMVLTVEPGCYIRPGEGVPERLCNIGVRIEDDALVTEHGCEILTAQAPKSVAEVEAAMRD